MYIADLAIEGEDWSSPLDWLGQFVACESFHSLGQTLELQSYGKHS